jgi:hypothetical protein
MMDVYLFLQVAADTMPIWVNCFIFFAPSNGGKAMQFYRINQKATKFDDLHLLCG